MTSPALMNRVRTLAFRAVCMFSALAWTATPAWAHPNTGLGVGFVSGFTHPLTGIDHILAMVAVGIWGNPASQACHLATAGHFRAGDVSRRSPGSARRAAPRR
jgi:hydrogenase/urease accessory protein HupE